MQTHRKRDNKSDWQGQIPRSVGTDRACFGRLCCLGYTGQLRSIFTASETKPAHTSGDTCHSFDSKYANVVQNVLVISVKFAWKLHNGCKWHCFGLRLSAFEVERENRSRYSFSKLSLSRVHNYVYYILMLLIFVRKTKHTNKKKPLRWSINAFEIKLMLMATSPLSRVKHHHHHRRVCFKTAI